MTALRATSLPVPEVVAIATMGGRLAVIRSLPFAWSSYCARGSGCVTPRRMTLAASRGLPSKRNNAVAALAAIAFNTCQDVGLRRVIVHVVEQAERYIRGRSGHTLGKPRLHDPRVSDQKRSPDAQAIDLIA